MTLENRFDIPFTAALAKKEKQIQQNYRPIIGIHKWFARRPGTVFRSLLLSEYNGNEPIETEFWKSHQFKGIIADPFMGGGTPIFEANRLGFSVIGTDINPMAFWIVRQSLASIDLKAFIQTAHTVISDIEEKIRPFYLTRCVNCGVTAETKYFIWVKTQACPKCGKINDLFPGYLLAEAVRHPKHVIACPHCGSLNEYDLKPKKDKTKKCHRCKKPVFIEGPAKHKRIACTVCDHVFQYPPKEPLGPPKHRMWGIEYHCHSCKPGHKGRFFKKPDKEDIERFNQAREQLANNENALPLPSDEIPIGDETKRLHRWGYKFFREMFNPRQLLGLGMLLQRIMEVPDASNRHALLTVFSDFLRYQNMLARYDTYALKCQDIFSVHGFPVGLVQCENNLLGIEKVGSGAYRHFIEKYVRAKQYCKQPFETRNNGRGKKIIPIEGERLEAKFVNRLPEANREAWISSSSAEEITLHPNSLDGVFTDPPYFDNVQYAELMDFCYAWLRIALSREFPDFCATTTRTLEELTGNDTMGRGIEHFTNGLSRIFRHYAAALKEGAPFVFTFHHNDPRAYIPLIVAILDADLHCCAALPVPAEMNASLHIARTKSSTLDSVFVCRRSIKEYRQTMDVSEKLASDIKMLKAAELFPSEGDIRCLASGHIARWAVNKLKNGWNPAKQLKSRIAKVDTFLINAVEKVQLENLIKETMQMTI